jgi:PhnB protein
MIRTSLAPWLSVSNAVIATDFYKRAFGAIETYRLETPEGLVVKLAVDRAEFWISGGSTDREAEAAQPLGGDAVRMILTTSDPDELFNRALKAGASEIFPVGEDHGWRLGRLADPFGLHWEIGHLIHIES